MWPRPVIPRLTLACTPPSPSCGHRRRCRCCWCCWCCRYDEHPSLGAAPLRRERSFSCLARQQRLQRLQQGRSSLVGASHSWSRQRLPRPERPGCVSLAESHRHSYRRCSRAGGGAEGHGHGQRCGSLVGLLSVLVCGAKEGGA